MKKILFCSLLFMFACSSSPTTVALTEKQQSFYDQQKKLQMQKYEKVNSFTDFVNLDSDFEKQKFVLYLIENYNSQILLSLTENSTPETNKNYKKVQSQLSYFYEQSLLNLINQKNKNDSLIFIKNLSQTLVEQWQSNKEFSSFTISTDLNSIYEKHKAQIAKFNKSKDRITIIPFNYFMTQTDEAVNSFKFKFMQLYKSDLTQSLVQNTTVESTPNTLKNSGDIVPTESRLPASN